MIFNITLKISNEVSTTINAFESMLTINSKYIERGNLFLEWRLSINRDTKYPVMPANAEYIYGSAINLLNHPSKRLLKLFDNAVFWFKIISV